MFCSDVMIVFAYFLMGYSIAKVKLYFIGKRSWINAIIEPLSFWGAVSPENDGFLICILSDVANSSPANVGVQKVYTVIISFIWPLKLLGGFGIFVVGAFHYMLSLIMQKIAGKS